MKLKLDENLPHIAAVVLVAYGHDVVTVAEAALAGADDTDVARVAAVEGRMLVTMDRGSADIRRYPPGQHPGILLLRLSERPASPYRGSHAHSVVAGIRFGSARRLRGGRPAEHRPCPAPSTWLVAEAGALLPGGWCH